MEINESNEKNEIGENKEKNKKSESVKKDEVSSDCDKEKSNENVLNMNDFYKLSENLFIKVKEKKIMKNFGLNIFSEENEFE